MTRRAHPAPLPEQLRLARQLQQSGRPAQSQEIYERLLRLQPQNIEALHQLGIIAAQAKDLEKAAGLIGRAIDADPRNAAAFNDRGVVLKGLERWDAALDSLNHAIALQPGYAAAYNNRGNVLRELRQWQAALDNYDQAIALDPSYSDAHNNRGVLLNDLNQWDAALASFDRAIAARPGHANAFCNRGVALEHLDRLDAALASYDRAVAIESGFVQAHANRGNVLRQLQRPDAAIASCSRALALAPEHAPAHQNKAVALLLLGEFSAGWTEYEWRWKNSSSALFQDRLRFSQPLWLGQEQLNGRTILLHSEQGMGDTLQFCRYAKRIADLGARVILEVQPPLAGLLADLDGVSRVVARGDALPDFDVHCPLMSLPLALRTTTLAAIPAHVPYLRSPPDKTLFWRDKLGPKTTLRVGLVWSGGFRPNQPDVWAVNKRRNIPLSELAPLRHPRIEFFSLQKGQPAESELTEQVSNHWNGPPMIDFTGLLHDFADTAALIEQLDLIISVDTSTAHLAGALGKPVWMLNRFDTCWRWLLHRTDSPWYPTARIYRQESAGNWHGVIERVAADLAALAIQA